MKTARSLLLAPLLALAAAGTASAAPTVSAQTVDEGKPLAVAITHKCTKKAKCIYAISTIDGTAKAPGDFTAATLNASAKKGKTLTRTFNVLTTDDAVCEKDPETLTVRVSVTRNGATNDFDTTETITDNDCEPAIGVTVPAPPPGAAVDNKPTATGTTKTCATAPEIGTADNTGFFAVQPCSIAVWCPTSATSCTVASTSTIVAQPSTTPEQVRSGAQTSVVTGTTAGTTKDTTCAGANSCPAIAPDLTLKPGEFALLKCSGAHLPIQIPPAAPRGPAFTQLICQQKLTLGA